MKLKPVKLTREQYERYKRNAAIVKRLEDEYAAIGGEPYPDSIWINVPVEITDGDERIETWY